MRKRETLKFAAYGLVALLAFCCVLALPMVPVVHASGDDGTAVLMLQETAAPSAAATADTQQALPDGSADNSPGSGPPAGGGSSLVSVLMGVGVLAGIAVAGLLAFSVYRKK